MSDRLYPGTRKGWEFAIWAANYAALATGRRHRIHHIGFAGHRHWVVSEVMR